jgi:hypothetical protein
MAQDPPPVHTACNFFVGELRLKFSYFLQSVSILFFSVLPFAQLHYLKSQFKERTFWVVFLEALTFRALHPHSAETSFEKYGLNNLIKRLATYHFLIPLMVPRVSALLRCPIQKRG